MLAETVPLSETVIVWLRVLRGDRLPAGSAVVFAEAEIKGEEVRVAAAEVAAALLVAVVLRVRDGEEDLLLRVEAEGVTEALPQGEELRMAEAEAERLTVRQAEGLPEPAPLSVPEVLRGRESQRHCRRVKSCAWLKLRQRD